MSFFILLRGVGMGGGAASVTYNGPVYFLTVGIWIDGAKNAGVWVDGSKETGVWVDGAKNLGVRGE